MPLSKPQGIRERNSLVVMLEESPVTGDQILLSDIASIESPDEALAYILGDIHICPAPEPGFSQVLHIGYVKSRVRQAGIAPESIHWSGSQRAVVTCLATRLSPQELLSHAEKFIFDAAERAILGSPSARSIGVGSPSQALKSPPVKPGGTRGSEQRGKTGASAPVAKNSELDTQRIQHPVFSIQVRPVNEIRPVILPRGKVTIEVESVSSLSSSGIIALRFTILGSPSQALKKFEQRGKTGADAPVARNSDAVDDQASEILAPPAYARANPRCEKRVILFRIEVFIEVLIAAHALDRHKIIEADDLQKAVRDVARYLVLDLGPAPVYAGGARNTGVGSPSQALKSPLRQGSEQRGKTGAPAPVARRTETHNTLPESFGDLVGKRVTRAIAKSDIITSDMVETPPIISQGDLVTILIESPAFRIAAQGKAREDGTFGQIIRVVNTSSMKEVAAQVVDGSSVRITIRDL